MANVIDQITVGDLTIMNVDAAPGASAGTPAATGSWAVFSNTWYIKNSATDVDWVSIPTAVTDLAAYLKLAGRVGGQIAYGGTAASESLVFHSTSHATKGVISFGSALTVDEATGFFGLGVTPTSFFHTKQNTVENLIDYAKGQTTDAATALNLASFTTTAGSVYHIKYTITGIETTTKDSLTVERTARVKNVGGTVTINTAQSDYTSKDSSITTATIVPTVSTANIILVIHGVASKTINWKVKREIIL
jgi:hypothetical protein